MKKLLISAFILLAIFCCENNKPEIEQPLKGAYDSIIGEWVCINNRDKFSFEFFDDKSVHHLYYTQSDTIEYYGKFYFKNKDTLIINLNLSNEDVPYLFINDSIRKIIYKGNREYKKMIDCDETCLAELNQLLIGNWKGLTINEINTYYDNLSLSNNFSTEESDSLNYILSFNENGRIYEIFNQNDTSELFEYFYKVFPGNYLYRMDYRTYMEKRTPVIHYFNYWMHSDTLFIENWDTHKLFDNIYKTFKIEKFIKQ